MVDHHFGNQNLGRRYVDSKYTCLRHFQSNECTKSRNCKGTPSPRFTVVGQAKCVLAHGLVDACCAAETLGSGMPAARSLVPQDFTLSITTIRSWRVYRLRYYSFMVILISPTYFVRCKLHMYYMYYVYTYISLDKQCIYIFNNNIYICIYIYVYIYICIYIIYVYNIEILRYKYMTGAMFEVRLTLRNKDQQIFTRTWRIWWIAICLFASGWTMNGVANPNSQWDMMIAGIQTGPSICPKGTSWVCKSQRLVMICLMKVGWPTMASRNEDLDSLVSSFVGGFSMSPFVAELRHRRFLIFVF